MTDKQVNKTTEALKLAEEALESCNSGKWSMSFDEIDVERALAAIREALAEQDKQEPFMCEPVPPVSEDGWTDWVCPTPQGYLMQCCDCGLIHEVDSRVAKYEPMPSEEFEVVDDPDMQCQWRMRRRDDLSNPVKQEPVAIVVEVDRHGDATVVSGAWQLDGGTHTFYAAPVSAKREWVDLTPIELAEAFVDKGSADAGIRAVIAAFKEKNSV